MVNGQLFCKAKIYPILYTFLLSASLVSTLFQVENSRILFPGLLLSILLFHIIQKTYGRIRFIHLLLDICVVGMALLGATNQLVLVSSLIFTALGINIIRVELLRSNQYLHRNRLYYWIPVVFGQVIADWFFFDPIHPLFHPVRVLVFGTLLLINLSSPLPDLKFILQKSLQKTVLFFIVFLTLILALAWINTAILPNFKWTLLGSVLLLFIFIFTPLSEKLEITTQKIFRMRKVNTPGLITEFDQRIRKTTGLDSVVLSTNQFITEKIGADFCKTILVEKVQDTNGSIGYLLQEFVGTATRSSPSSLFLGKLDRIAESFLNFLRPIQSFDLEFSAEYEKVPGEIKDWFKAFKAELFIPIFEKQNWIGLLAVGPREKNRYDPSELVFLRSVAIQVGTSLENARLIDKLTAANDELKRSIANLENISRDLSNLENIKSNFISIASHELRTPLTVTRGYVEMLMEDEALPTTQKDLLKGIYKGVLKQEEILDSLFELAKLDSSSEQLRREEISVNDLVKEVSQKMMKVINQRNQVLMIDLPQLPKIWGDKSSIRRLLLNLLQNSVKFTPDHGKITVSGFAITDRENEEVGVELVVRDTGVGISKELQEVIFTRFYQPGEKIDTLSSGKFKFQGSGLGLGLALSRAIVKAHGGRIWATSAGYDERGLPGSEFHIFFPFNPQNILPEYKKDH